MQVYAVTDIGKRAQNEDSFWVATIGVELEGGDLSQVGNTPGELPANVVEGSIICVCDGMGGLSRGDVASQTVIKYIRDTVQSGTVSIDSLVDTINAASNDLYKLGQSQGARLGTTCTVIILVNGEYRILHVGDSRCYKINRDSTYTVLTEDHTAFNKFRKEGQLIRIDERNVQVRGKVQRIGQLRSKLTKSVGVKPEVEVDVLEGIYSRGDMFLISSDGFWHGLEIDPRWTINLRHAVNKEEHFSKLIEKFKRAGASDNLTVTMVVC